MVTGFKFFFYVEVLLFFHQSDYCYNLHYFFRSFGKGELRADQVSPQRRRRFRYQDSFELQLTEHSHVVVHQMQANSKFALL